MATPAVDPPIVAWTIDVTDQSPQLYIRVSAALSARIDTLRTQTLSADAAEICRQAIVIQQLLPSGLSTWVLRGLPTQELVTRLRAERDAARTECDEHMTGEERLQQRLADAEIIMNRLARTAADPSEPPTPRDQAERIADPNRFDGTREKLKAFKDQLLVLPTGPTRKKRFGSGSEPTRFQIRGPGRQ